MDGDTTVEILAQALYALMDSTGVCSWLIKCLSIKRITLHTKVSNDSTWNLLLRFSSMQTARTCENNLKCATPHSHCWHWEPYSEMGNLAPILSQNIKFFSTKGMRIESRNDTPWASTDFVFRHLVFV